MNYKENIILDNLSIYMNDKLKHKYKHKHTDETEWVRFYYYKKRKPFLVPTSNIRYDSDVTSTNSLHKHTFYKMSHLSKIDSHYDYYYKLKENINECVIKENKRNSKKKKNVIKSIQKNTITKHTDKSLFTIQFD